MQAPDEREILNWAAFMRDLPSDAPRDLEAIRDLHERLFDGVMSDHGRWKPHANFVGRRDGRDAVVTFIPAAPGRVEPELRNALDWVHTAGENPMVRAMVFFHEFEGIHPFRDGNGRVGRALFTWMLHAAGYRGIRYALVDYTFNRDRDEYYGNLARVERGGYDFTSWLDYMSTVLEETFQEALVRFELGRQVPDLNQRQVRVAMWMRRVLRASPRRRIKFGDVHAAFPQLNRRTLQEDIRRLVEQGILDREGERKATTYGLPSDERGRA
jgi:Fic family protein